MIKYSFIILTYNSKKTIEDCVNSIYENVKNESFEVIVVDNQSPDNTADFVEEQLGDKVRLIRSPENGGFSKGNNLGIKQAKGEYIMLLNPDATVESLDFDLIQDWFTKEEKLGILAPQVIWPNKVKQPSFGFFPTRLKLFLYFFKIFTLLPDGFLVYNNRWNKKYYETSHEVDWVSGCCMIIPRNVFEEVEYFDEQYFLYVEDVDLCKKIKNAGYKVIVDPKLVVSHILQASVQQDFAKNLDFQSDGFVYYFKKFHNTNVKRFMDFVYMLKKKRLPKQK